MEQLPDSIDDATRNASALHEVHKARAGIFRQSRRLDHTRSTRQNAFVRENVIWVEEPDPRISGVTGGKFVQYFQVRFAPRYSADHDRMANVVQADRFARMQNRPASRLGSLIQGTAPRSRIQQLPIENLSESLQFRLCSSAYSIRMVLSLRPGPPSKPKYRVCFRVGTASPPMAILIDYKTGRNAAVLSRR